jgi:hypothetical protein
MLLSSLILRETNSELTHSQTVKITQDLKILSTILNIHNPLCRKTKPIYMILF